MEETPHAAMCPVPWCSKLPEHDDLHYKLILDQRVTWPLTGRVVLALESSGNDPLPTLTVTDRGGHTTSVILDLESASAIAGELARLSTRQREGA